MDNPNDYRVGDPVIVGPLEYLQWGKAQGLPLHGITPSNVAGKKGSIINPPYNTEALICTGDLGWCMPFWMFAHDFRWGQVIEVRDMEEVRWLRRVFSGYAWGIGRPIQCAFDYPPKRDNTPINWRYARPIRPEKVSDSAGQELTEYEAHFVCPDCGKRIYARIVPNPRRSQTK